jgi:hypothetical protein
LRAMAKVRVIDTPKCGFDTPTDTPRFARCPETSCYILDEDRIVNL